MLLVHVTRSIPQCLTCFYLQIPISRHLVPVTEQRSRFALFWAWRFRSDFSNLYKVRLLFVPLSFQQNMTSVAALAGIPTATGTKVSLPSRRGHVLWLVRRINCENGNGVWLPLKSESGLKALLKGRKLSYLIKNKLTNHTSWLHKQVF